MSLTPDSTAQDVRPAKLLGADSGEFHVFPDFVVFLGGSGYCTGLMPGAGRRNANGARGRDEEVRATDGTKGSKESTATNRKQVKE